MKQLITIFLCFCMSLVSLSAFAEDALPYPEAQTSAVNIEIPITDLYVGDEVYIEAKLNQQLPLYAFETNYTYDTTALRFKEITATGHLTAYTKEVSSEPSNGKGSYLITSVGEPSAQASNNLFRMTFIAKKTGKTTVILDGLTLVYPDLAYQRAEKKLTAEIMIKSKSSGTGGGGGGSVKPNRPSSNIQINFPTTSATSPIQTNAPVTPDADIPPFIDLNGFDWAEEAILALTNQKILAGYEDKSFRPQNNLTRGELAKIITLVLQLPETTDNTMKFIDIKDTMWYSSYIYRTAENHLVNGYEDQTFRPETEITREEFATILARAANYQNTVLPSRRLNINFTDEENISAYAVPYVDNLYMAEILNGDDNGAFRPQEPLTRAEAAVGIWRYLKTTQTGKEDIE